MKRLVQGYCYPVCCVDVISFFTGDVQLHTYISRYINFIHYVYTVSVVSIGQNTYRMLMSQGTTCIEGFIGISGCWECNRMLHLVSGLRGEILTYAATCCLRMYSHVWLNIPTLNCSVRIHDCNCLLCMYSQVLLLHLAMSVRFH